VKGSLPSRCGGALIEIARLGGGVVESYPEDVEGRRISGSFLHNGTVAMFELEGFTRSRRLGKNHWVVTKTVTRLVLDGNDWGRCGRHKPLTASSTCPFISL
jgi:hypothetical protein